jgi:hypothetical protein
MYTLSYFYGATLKEQYHFNSKALCHWKQKQLIAAGTHLSGTFTIQKV